MKHFKRIIIIALAAMATTVMADPTVYLDFGEDSYHLGLFTAPVQTEYGNLTVNPDLIVKDDDEYVVTPGVHWQYITKQSPFIYDVGVGINLYFTHFDDQDVDALAPGFWIRTQEMLNIPIKLAGEIHYAPEGFAFDDGVNFLDWAAQAEYQLFQPIVIYAGYRQITSKTEDLGYKTVDETPYIGFAYTFN